MWKIAAIVILWMGVFAAMKESVAAGVVETIKGGAEATGKFALKALRYAPVFPVKVDSDGDGKITDKDKTERFAFGDAFKMPAVLGEAVTKMETKSKDRARGLLGIEKPEHAKNMEGLEEAQTKPNKESYLKKVLAADTLTPQDQKKTLIALAKDGHFAIKDDSSYKNLLKDIEDGKLNTTQFKARLETDVMQKDPSKFNGHTKVADYVGSATKPGGGSTEQLEGDAAVGHIQSRLNSLDGAVRSNNNKQIMMGTF